jgi:hypothetical protein
MDTEDKQLIKAIVLEHMLDTMDTDQARTVTDLIIDDVVKDVEECADGENWNDSDVRLAIGRVLIQRCSPAEHKVYVTSYTTRSGHDGELTTDVYINPTMERAEEATGTTSHSSSIIDICNPNCSRLQWKKPAESV